MDEANRTRNGTDAEVETVLQNRTVAGAEALQSQTSDDRISYCAHPSDFSLDLGVFAVAGPTGHTVEDLATGLPRLLVGRNFSLTVHGQGLTDSGRVLILSGDAACGDADASNSTADLAGILADDPDSAGGGENLTVARTWSPLTLSRGGRFQICWCSGRSSACSTGPDFRVTVGYFSVKWNGDYRVRNAEGKELRALPGMLFTLQVSGIELSAADRVRIVELSTTCGGPGSASNTAALRGPLTRVPGHSGYSYTPGVLSGPGLLGRGGSSLQWSGLRLISGGVRRVCWCPGGGQSGSSTVGCSGDADFYTELGTFDTLRISDAWPDACSRTKQPMRVHVAAVGLRPKVDRIMVARAADVCGEAVPQGLMPFIVGTDPVRRDVGFASMECVEDPNAGATPGERKMVCGDGKSMIQMSEPGLYRICVCASVPGYDCSHPSHYRTPAGKVFEVAGPEAAATGSWQDAVATSAAGGGATQPPMIMNGPGGPVITMAYAPLEIGTERMPRLAAGSEDGMIRLWEPNVPALVSELVGHTARVEALAWAPDASFLVSASADGTIRLWETVAGVAPDMKLLHKCPRWESVWERPGGDATAQVLTDWTPSGFDATDQEWQDALNVHLGSVVTRWLNLTDQGNTSQSSTRHGAISSRAIDGILDARWAGNSCTHTATQADPWWQVDLGGYYAVRGVKVTNRADCCGHWLSPFFVYVDGVDGTVECAANVTIEQGQTIEVPCAAIGSVVRIELHKPKEVLTLCEVGVRVQVTEDIAAGDDLVDISQLTLHKAARQCEKACAAYRERAFPMCECGPTIECHLTHSCVPRCGLEAYLWLPAPHVRVTAIAISPDGVAIASATTDNIIRLWAADERNRSSSPVAAIRGHHRSVLCLAFSPVVEAPSLLASGGDDARVIWHDTVAAMGGFAQTEMHRFEEPVGELVAVQAVAFSSDGRWFVVAGKSSATLWDMSTRTLLRTLEPPASKTRVPAEGVILPNGQLDMEQVPERFASHDGKLSSAIDMVFAADNKWLALRTPTDLQLWSLDSVAPDPTEQLVLGEWMPFTSKDLAAAPLRWAVSPGPADNRPWYEARADPTDGTLHLHFAPCNVSMLHACAEALPMVRVDIEVPFEFSAVRGSFIEYSTGANLADDCRGGTPHSAWEDHNAAAYWSLLRAGYRAEGEDCPRVGGGTAFGQESLAACHQECLASGVCNFVNYRQQPPSCDLRRCLDATNPVLILSPDDDPWALVLRTEAEERLAPTHDGYVMFGAPDASGTGGVVYPGCQAGKELPASGVQIQVVQTEVPRTNVLRFQVAQSRHSESLAIRDIVLELWRPDDYRHRMSVSSASAAVAFSPTRREVTTTVGAGSDLAVWDLRGIDFPSSFQAERLLKQVFSFSLSAVDLQDSDRVRVVDASVVPLCGDTFSATSAPVVQGIGHGQRTRGNSSRSVWEGVLVTAPGTYRICFCGGRSMACCTEDQDFAQQLHTFVVAGAAGGHYYVCEVDTSKFGKNINVDCIIEDFQGVGLKTGDMLMVQDAPACGLQSGFIPGIPTNGVMISRPYSLKGIDYAGGTWYRFEYENIGFGTYTVEPFQMQRGRTLRLCWCAQLAGCNRDNPADFRIDAGLMTVVRFEVEALVQTFCEIGKNCTVKVKLADMTPMVGSDLIMVKTGSTPPRRMADMRDPLICKGDPVQGFGRDGDGRSGRLRVEKSQSGEDEGVFDLGKTAAAAAQYRLCWCQASIRPCLLPSEFVADIGRLTVTEAKYVWPTCTAKEVPFNGWRNWQTFDDCCCNFAEAGAVGCFNTASDAYRRCSQLPLR